jgi:hypothetical protein
VKNSISLRRRQLLIAGAAGIALPLAGFGWNVNAAAASAITDPQKLVVSGRIVLADGKPLAGANVATAGTSALTDGDGRFVLETVAPAGRAPQLRYQVSHPSHATVTRELRAADAGGKNVQRDETGTWRTAIGLALA